MYNDCRTRSIWIIVRVKYTGRLRLLRLEWKEIDKNQAHFEIKKRKDTCIIIYVCTVNNILFGNTL